MIIAKTRCCECGAIVELDDKYGWTEFQEDAKNIVCDQCNEIYEQSDEFED